jgi:hypothetical protein
MKWASELSGEARKILCRAETKLSRMEDGGLKIEDGRWKIEGDGETSLSSILDLPFSTLYPLL